MDSYYTGGRMWQWAMTAIIIIILIIIGFLLFGDPHSSTPQSEEEWCKDYGDYYINSLPVKCFKYYGINVVK